MKVLIGCASLVGLFFGIRIYRNYFVWRRCKDNQNLKGKTVIITGANSGIGKATAQELVLRGAKVIMACRDEAKTIEAINDIKKHTKDNGEMVYRHVDLASFDSIEKFTNEIIQNEETIDVLINNAGVFKPPFGLTVNGFETQFQVNHLSHALLTLLLMPKLQKSGQRTQSISKVIMVTSVLAKRGVINEDDFVKGAAKLDKYDPYKSYCNSKLANIIFSKELQKRLERNNQPVHLYLSSPGIVWTNLNRHNKIPWWQLLFIAPFALLFLKTPKQGCQTIVYCAVNDSLQSGQFYRDCKLYNWKNPASINDSASSNVYDWTYQAIEKHL